MSNNIFLFLPATLHIPAFNILVWLQNIAALKRDHTALRMLCNALQSYVFYHKFYVKLI